MREHGQHGSEGAKACCEEDEEGKLFLWVHGHLVERWRQGVRAVSQIGREESQSRINNKQN